MRVSKEANERRNEIMDCALELFSVKGYEKTSVNDIMYRVGIAKGTLYYHFKSKEEILNAILNRLFESVLVKTQTIVDDTSLSVHEKLLKTLLSLDIKDTQGTEMLDVVHKPQNALMHQIMLEMMIQQVTPMLATIIEEGNKAGVFHTEYPHDSAEMFLTYSNVVFDEGFMVWEPELMMRKMHAFVCNMERVLGTKEGEMNYILELFQ